jgi:hypothetical protein
MKFRSTLLLFVVFATFFAMSSCVKKYTCHCDIKYTGYPGLPDSTVQEYDIKSSKKDAETKCKAESTSYDSSGIHAEETCYLY